MRCLISITMLLVIIGLSSATNASEPANKLNNPAVKVCDSTKSFFPVFGFRLGETTEDELNAFGTRNGRDDYYFYRGQKFWVRDGVFDSMYITSPQEVPKHWRNMGFSWYLTYDQIYGLFECLGFNVDAVENPHVGEYKGDNSFEAELFATKKSENLKVVIGFRYSRNTGRNSQNTIYKLKFGRVEI